MITLPNSFPFCPVDGSLATSFAENTTVFQPDVGPPMKRRRYSGTFESYGFEVIMTRAEWQAFITFHSETCADGSLPFLAPDPANHAQTAKFTFTKPPARKAWVANNSLFRVSIELLREPYTP